MSPATQSECKMRGQRTAAVAAAAAQATQLFKNLDFLVAEERLGHEWGLRRIAI